jgi:glycosyltransferase involved in cell wall biosynthesis
MRLLLFNYEYPPVGGGGGWVTHFLAREYARRGHEVLVLTSAYADLPRRETVDGYAVERVPAVRKNPNVAQVTEMLSYALSSSRVGMRRAREFRPDAAQVFFGIPSGLGAYLLRRRYGVPYVVFLGGRDVPRPNPDPPYYRYLYALLKPAILGIWRNAAHVVACSDGLRELARATAPDLPFRVIPDGIDLDKFPPKSYEPRPTVRILGIGRLIPRKGFDTLIRAAALLKASTPSPSAPIPSPFQGGGLGWGFVPSFEVEIVGDGPERTSLESLAKSLGVADRVRFAGSVPYDSLPGRYADADVYALTSHAEGMPLVVLEAMATGLPILATDVQGMDELVADGVNGWRFPVNDAEGLAARLAELIADPVRRESFGRASRERVQKYAWSNVAEAYLELLTDASERRGQR